MKFYTVLRETEDWENVTSDNFWENKEFKHFNCFRGNQLKLDKMKFNLKQAIEKFKDPYFVIQIWQNITILAFVVGVLLGATFTQNFYVEQVNTILTDAAEQDGCFNNYLNNYLMNNELGFMENFSSVGVYDIGNITSKPD